jgi:hypothetical protein
LIHSALRRALATPNRVPRTSGTSARDRFSNLLKATSTTQINAVRSCYWWQLFDCWAKAINLKKDLVEVECIGSEFAAELVGEMFYWSFDNRKQLARYVDLTPSHFQSDPKRHDQGITKAGNTKANDD